MSDTTTGSARVVNVAAGVDPIISLPGTLRSTNATIDPASADGSVDGDSQIRGSRS